MAFGKIKADTIAYTDTNQVEQDASVETLVDNANAIGANTTAIATKAPLGLSSSSTSAISFVTS